MLTAIITLAIVLVIVTLIPNIAPGDPARKIAGGTASPQRLTEVTEALGLNDSVPVQLGNLTKSVVTFDYGDSSSVARGETAMSLVWRALGNSAKLVIFALVIVIPTSILGGLVAAYKKDTWIDRMIALGQADNLLDGPAFDALRKFPEFKERQSRMAENRAKLNEAITTELADPNPNWVGDN